MTWFLQYYYLQLAGQFSLLYEIQFKVFRQTHRESETSRRPEFIRLPQSEIRHFMKRDRLFYIKTDRGCWGTWKPVRDILQTSRLLCKPICEDTQSICMKSVCNSSQDATKPSDTMYTQYLSIKSLTTYRAVPSISSRGNILASRDRSLIRNKYLLIWCSSSAN